MTIPNAYNIFDGTMLGFWDYMEYGGLLSLISYTEYIRLVGIEEVLKFCRLSPDAHPVH